MFCGRTCQARLPTAVRNVKGDSFTKQDGTRGKGVEVLASGKIKNPILETYSRKNL